MLCKAAPAILLVDDEELFRMTLKEVIRVKLPDAIVLEAGDGAEALAALDANHVDCVVSDLAMPIMDGIAFLTELFNRASTVPVIVVSAFAHDAPVAEGMLRCLPKPVDLFGLADHLEQLVGDAALAERSRVTLLGMLQLLCADRRSCAVRVGRRSDGPGAAPRGALVLRHGELVRATCRAALPCVGVEAAIELLQWDDAVITIAPDTRAAVEPSDADIPVPLAQIAARAIARRRHKARTTSSTPPSTKLEPKAPAECPLVARLVDDLMAIEGVIGAAVVDIEHGLAIGASGSSELSVAHVVTAARDLVSGQAAALRNAGVNGGVHELLLTLERQMHLLHPSRQRPSLVMYVACDRARAVLPLMRMRIAQAEQAFDASEVEAPVHGRA